jgi:cytochrome c oxidase subunit III
MPTTIAPPEDVTKTRENIGSGGGGIYDRGWGGDGPDNWGSSGPEKFETFHQSYRLAMWLAMASILMLFVALSSAYIVRQGFAQDWRSIAIPPLLWPNTFVLLGSSLTLEMARRSLKRLQVDAFKRWMTLTAVLGAAFLAGQIATWRALTAQGIYLNSNPHSSFFYLLTGIHGVHLLGGMIALCYVLFRAWQHGYIRVKGLAVIEVTAMYWHFMDGLWIYLFLLLFVWR